MEIYQNCNVFNDGAFDMLRERQHGVHNQIRLQQGEPIVFDEGTRCISVGENGRLVITEVENTLKDRIVTHDEHGRPSLAFALAHTAAHGPTEPDLHRRVPRGRAAGLRRSDAGPAPLRHRPARSGSVEKLLHSGDVWTVE